MAAPIYTPTVFLKSENIQKPRFEYLMDFLRHHKINSGVISWTYNRTRSGYL